MKKWIDKTIPELEKQNTLLSVLAILTFIEFAFLLILSIYVYENTALIALPIIGVMLGFMNLFICYDCLSSKQRNYILIMLKRIEEKK